MSTERNKEQAGALKQYEYTDAVETAKAYFKGDDLAATDRKSTRLNSSHVKRSRMPSSA